MTHRPHRRLLGLYCIHALEVTQFQHLAIARFKLTGFSNVTQRPAFVRIKYQLRLQLIKGEVQRE